MKRNAYQWAGHCHNAYSEHNPTPMVKVVEEIIADARRDALEAAAGVVNEVATEESFSGLSHHVPPLTRAEVRIRALIMTPGDGT